MEDTLKILAELDVLSYAILGIAIEQNLAKRESRACALASLMDDLIREAERKLLE